MESGRTRERGRRRFLFLQGPHGPFFAALAAVLEARGVPCFKLGVSRGERLFWRREGWRRFDGGPDDWPGALAALIGRDGITELALYGAERPLHRAALRVAREAGIATHLFEEGYLRPYWITYERDGTNGASPACAVPLSVMAALGAGDAPPPPVRWGETRQHLGWAALSHAASLLAGPVALPPHRDLSLGAEAKVIAGAALGWPLRLLRREAAVARLRQSGAPYHLVLMQLEHDAAYRTWRAHGSTRDFLGEVIGGFASGAPEGHRLVIAAHPFEDGRAGLPDVAAEAAARADVSDRVTLLPGGKLARLLDGAQSVVTATSSAAHQALWRGLPVKAFGRSPYARPGVTSDQPIAAFFARPDRPDAAIYAALRAYLLATSQVRGGFYSAAGRDAAIAALLPRLLSADNHRSAAPDAAERQHLDPVG